MITKTTTITNKNCIWEGMNLIVCKLHYREAISDTIPMCL